MNDKLACLKVIEFLSTKQIRTNYIVIVTPSFDLIRRDMRFDKNNNKLLRSQLID